jgi:hypothetical protein
LDNQIDTISKLYNYSPLKVYTGLEGKIPIKHKDVMFGVEVELEQVNNPYKIGTNIVTEDGSLKVNGMEFVTIPLKLRYLEVELTRIFSGLKKPLVSSRCSIHVHMNVRDMTPNQLTNMVLLYAIFERGLYRISGDRWNSNFCVPIGLAPQMLKVVFNNWNNPTQWHWSKYTGMNLCPIWGGEGSKKIGTVEFRQMHGSTDVKEIIGWCNMIAALKRAAQKIDQEELLSHIRIMNTTSGYYWLVREVFGKWSKLLSHQPTFAEDVEKAIAILKQNMPKGKLVAKEKTVDKKKELNFSSPSKTIATKAWDILPLDLKASLEPGTSVNYF